MQDGEQRQARAWRYVAAQASRIAQHFFKALALRFISLLSLSPPSSSLVCVLPLVPTHSAKPGTEDYLKRSILLDESLHAPFSILTSPPQSPPRCDS
ncbi:hypothetical protein FA10DRAFT_197696 [Acaromyces ingoldii]|uniref:Uncharacterized protein n=1 Tax=Acaromyces ingoldii TaxID=215250 RepID=A0A316YCI0_9BASI|nr:hypothetical protein FA10DRAFT_197696 [Acaromyces ingoldii]PWN87187.1 hypothetical protein FA10DRAFT_197696 [Acaromyces ingoldii]